MKILLVMILFLLTFSNDLFSALKQTYTKMVGQMSMDFSKQAMKSDGLMLIGSGGEMKNDIKVIAMHFHLDANMNIEHSGKVFNVAHSQGGILTNNMKGALLDNQLKTLYIYTLGTASM